MLRGFALAMLKVFVAAFYKFALLLKLYVGVLEREALRGAAGGQGEQEAQRRVDSGECVGFCLTVTLRNSDLLAW
jgi:hypothetical protein